MWKVSLWAIFLISLSLHCIRAADEGCPEDADILLCTCSNSSSNIIIDCSAALYENDIRDAFKADFPVRDMYRLDLLNNKFITAFTENVFGSATFRVLNFNGCELSHVDDTFFNNLHNSLETITFINSRLDNAGFSFDILSSLNSLTTLNLYGNFFTSVPPLLSTTLTHFNINNNDITSVDRNAFQTCLDMYDLRMEYNEISSLDLYLFQGLFNLRNLYLDHNVITTYQSGQFAELTNLVVLQIGYNPVTVLGEALFVNLPKLTTLHMHDLMITTLRGEMFFNVPNLENWILSIGELKSITSNMFIPFPKLSNLKIDENRFETIQTGKFSGFTAKGTIYLTSNVISTIEDGAFPDLESSELYLDSNLIMTLDETWLKPIFDQQNSVSVDNNPLLCGCDIAWIFFDTAYLAQFLGTPTCSNGTSIFQLNQNYYIDNCA